MSPRSRRLRIAAAVAGGLVVLLLGAAMLIPRLVDVDSLRPAIQRILSDRLERHVAFSDLEFGILPIPTIRLTDLVVGGTGGAEPWIEAKALRVRVKLLPILGGRLEIVGLAADEPTLRVLRAADGRVNLVELARGKDGVPSPQRVDIGPIRVRRGRVIVQDAFVTPGSIRRLEIGDLDLALSGLDGAIDVDVTGRVLPSGGTVSFDGEVEPSVSIDGHAKLDGLDLASVSPWFEAATGMADITGRVTCDLDVARRVGGSARGKGSLSFAQLLLPIAARGTRPLDAAVVVDIDVAAGGATTIERLDLETGATKLALSGSVSAADGRQILQVDLARSTVLGSDLLALARAFGQVLPVEALGSEPVTLALRAHVTREGDPRRVSRVAIDGLQASGGRVVVVRDAAGGWSVPGAATARPARPAPGGIVIAARDVHVEGLAVRMEDRSVGGFGNVDAGDVKLDLATYQAGQPGPFEASARIAGGRVAVRGQLATGGGGQSAFDVVVEGARLAELRPMLEPLMGLAPSDGTLSWKARVAGEPGGALAAKGTMQLAGAHLTLPSGESVVLDLPIAHDIEIGEGRSMVARSVVLGLPDGELRLRGRSRPGRLEIATDGPARLSPAAVRWLLALAGPRLPFGLVTDDPMGIDARIAREGESLEVAGHIDVSKARLTHALLPGPLDVAKARVALAGDRVDVTEASLRLGQSALSGSLSIEDFDSPRITFDLTSPDADLDELFAITGNASDRGAPANGDAPLVDRLRGAGRLRIGQAHFSGLAFSQFDARVELQGGTLRIDPASLSLYDGTARATAAFDLGGSRVGFEVDAAFEGIEVQPLLVAGLDYEDLSGRGRATAHLVGTASGLDAALRSLEGSGELNLADGVFRGLNAMQSLRKASVFGERSLAALGERLARDGTSFERLAGRYAIAGGVMTMTDLVVVTPDFEIHGSGTCGLLTRQLDLDAVILFSEMLSSEMRAEGSQAAEIFWDAARSRVVLPTRLTGPLASPSANIDWGTAAARLAQRRLADELGRALGGDRGSGSSGPGGPSGSPSNGLQGALEQILGRGPSRPSPGATEPAGEGSSGGGEAPSRAAAPAAGPQASIESLGFGGSMLAPDLKIQATLSGSNLSHAIVTVTDENGRVLESRSDAFRTELESFYATAPRDAPASIPVKLRVEGRRLLSAKTIVVTVRAVNRAGEASSDTRAETKRTSLF